MSRLAVNESASGPIPEVILLQHRFMPRRICGGLARIIHEASTAAADPGMSTAYACFSCARSIGLLDVLSSTFAGRSVARRLAKRRIAAHLRRLATNLHE